jgi:hypothetical protein
MNGALVVTDCETKDAPEGLLIEIVVAPPVLVIVLLDVRRLTLWPAVPSKTSNPIWLAVLIVTVWLPPSETRFVEPTLEAVKGLGGTKKSLALDTVPAGVARTRCPEVAGLGTATERLVVVALEGFDGAMLNFTLSLAEVVSKLVPLIDTDVPGVPTEGEKLVIVG